LLVRAFELADEPAVIALWERCGLTRSWNDPREDIRRKLDVRPDLFLVGVLEGRVVASVMAGYEGHRGWINYLAVSPEHQRKGFGRIMMAEAERRLHEAGCPKINLQVRSSNTAVIEFYRRLGYGVDDVVSMGKRLVNDEPGGSCGGESEDQPAARRKQGLEGREEQRKGQEAARRPSSQAARRRRTADDGRQ
jgi:GNAT superfamily N-acetyltransferase